MSTKTSLHLPIAGLRLAFLDPHNAEILSDGGRLHFLIKLDELQFQDLMGRVHKPNSPDNAADVARVNELNSRTFETIPMHLLAAFFYSAEPGQRTTNPRNLQHQNIGSLLRKHLRTNPFNESFANVLGGSVIPTTVQYEADPGSTLPPTPVVLALDVEFDGGRTFYRKYRRELQSPTGKSFETEIKPLRDTLRSKIDAVEEKIETQAKIAQPMRQAVGHLHVGDTLFQAALDFRESLPVRKSLWKGVQFNPDGQYPEPYPNKTQVGNVRALRNDWDQLIKLGSDFVAHHASGARLDDTTLPILSELRNGQAVWKQYFDKRRTLHPSVRAELLQTIADALDCVVLGEKSRAALLHREIALIAEHVSLAFDASKTSAADQVLVAELLSLDVAKLLPAESKSAPLFDAFKESMEWIYETKDTTERSLEGLSILNIVTPAIVEHLRAQGDTGSAALAWLWRAAIGTGQLEAESLRRLQTQVLEFIGSGQAAPASVRLKIRSPIPPKLASAVGIGSSFFSLISDLLAIHTAHEKAERLGSQADGVITVATAASALKSTADVAQVVLATLASNVANEQWAARFSTAAKGLDKAGPLLAIVTGFLTFVASYAKNHERDIFRTRREQDDLETTQYLDALGILVNLAGTQPALKFLVVVFAVGRGLVENPDSWLPALHPSLEAPTQAQLFLANHLETLLNEPGFRKLMTELDSGATPDTPGKAAEKFLKELKAQRSSLSNAVEDSTPLLWALGSRLTFGQDTHRDSVRVLHKIYGFPEKAAEAIVYGEDAS